MTHRCSRQRVYQIRPHFFFWVKLLSSEILNKYSQFLRIREQKTILREGLVDTMRSKFDRQLDKLNRELIEMGALCENAIDCAIRGVANHDKETADETLSIEEEINQIERILKVCV